MTRQRIKALQEALMALRHNQLSENYAQIAQNFLYDIKRMEAEVHAYLQHCPAPEDSGVKIPI